MFIISNKNKVIDQEVSFYNSKDGITLVGTLSIPEFQTKPAVVILIAGYGPNDRDCTVMGRKLFLDISQYFIDNGIAVLRYDKRGVGQSSGKYDLTLTSADFAQDALEAVQFLKKRSDIDSAKIGLVGASEGGLISFMVASQSKDVAFVVSLAGATSNNVITHYQMQLKVDGASDVFLVNDKKIREKIFAIINTQTAEEAQNSLLSSIKFYIDNLTDKEKDEGKNLFYAITEENYQKLIDQLNSAWYRFYLKTDSIDFISKVKVPVLAINGDLDFIIAANTALPKIEKGLKIANNHHATILTIHNQNHWFQQCKTGSVKEYYEIKENMHESTLKLITDWIQKTIKSL